MKRNIEHVVVLMLENRSFDHMLGYMDYPAFRPYRLTGEEQNLDSTGRAVRVSMDAAPVNSSDPRHYFEDVLEQLFEAKFEPGRYPPPPRAKNSGFVKSYEKVAGRERAGDVMRCFDPRSATRNLATLAQGFAVLPRWYCSLPSATWPNRNFAHAATSEGWVKNPSATNWKPGLLKAKTIYQQLDEAKRTWRVYGHDPLIQALGFSYVLKKYFSNVRFMNSFYEDVKKDRLPSYSFIEPHHVYGCNSQHPYYIGSDRSAFARGEKLIKDVYDALKRDPKVFAKTMLLITYDEHGGFFDREPPPETVAPDSRRRDPHRYDFRLLGPRVPAVLVSPWIRKETVDATTYDHSSIPKTVRSLLSPALSPLTARDARAESFERNLGDTLRTDLPELRAPDLPEEEVTLSSTTLSTFGSFRSSLLDLTLAIGEAMEAAGGLPEVEEVEAILARGSLLSTFGSDRALHDRLGEIEASMREAVGRHGGG